MAVDFTKVTSARAKAAIAKRQRTEVLPSLYKSLTNDAAREKNLKDRVILYDEEIAAQEKVLELAKNGTITPGQTVESQQAIVDNLKANRNKEVMNEYNTFRTDRAIEKSFQELKAQNLVAAAASKITTTAVGAYNQASTTLSTGELVYNASAVREAYFGEYKSENMPQLMKSTNQPSLVTKATDLWGSVVGSKGMIVTSEQVLKAWNSGSNSPESASYFDKNNYGFQFQYNPGTVSMTYQTSPNVDVTMMTSGQEMFNLAGTSSSQGSVNFQIVINRIFDMQYYTPLKQLEPGRQDRYSKPPANLQEENDIYDKGTMYDIEFLLRTLMGTSMLSYLRAGRTADMGWLPAIPVELHLGKSMRYLGTVNSLSLNHMIFNERMVPTLTTVDINFSRLPDYPPAGQRPNPIS
jgi:hypothetical protein